MACRSSMCACRSTGNSSSRSGEKIAAIAEPRGFKIPREYYEPLPDFLPCLSHECNKAGFDFYGLLLPRHRPHQQLHHGKPLARRSRAARPFLLQDRDQPRRGRQARLDGRTLVWVESGDRAQGQGPPAADGGHPSRGPRLRRHVRPLDDGQPVAKGKGVFFNDLLELDWDHASPVNINLDFCVKVSVMPAEDVP